VITGNINRDGLAVLVLAVAGRSWPVIIDTGFNGDLELPQVNVARSCGSLAEDHSFALKRWTSRTRASWISISNPGMRSSICLQNAETPLRREPMTPPVSWL
jgi:hypothetical protein